MKTFCVVLLTIFTLGCGYGSNYNSGMGTAGAPSIQALVPNTATSGGPAFTLTVNGTNFTGASGVYWAGTTRTTHFVTAMQITADITAADIANPATVVVYVRTNGSAYSGGGVNSNNVNFMVQ